MSDGDPYGYGTGHSSGQQYPPQGNVGPQGNYPGPQGGYPGGYSQPPAYGQGQAQYYPVPQSGYQQAPYHQGQAQNYYQNDQTYPGGPAMSGHGSPPVQSYNNQGSPISGQGLPPAQRREQSGWGSTPNFGNQYHQGSSTGPQAMPQDDVTRGLTSKLSSLMSHKRHDSSSDSSDDDAKKKKKKDKKKGKNNNFATMPNSNPRDGPYPFSLFCPRDNPELIVFEVVDGGDARDLLVGPNQDKKHPAYEILYDEQGDFKVNRIEIPDLNPKHGVNAGRVELRNDGDDLERNHYFFPWLDWDFGVETEWWASDVGLLQGKSYMKWVLLSAVNTNKTGKWAVRLFDTSTDTAPTVATFYVDSYIDGVTEGRLQIVARLVRTYEQLDEMVVIALGVMDYHRKNISDNMSD